MEKNTTLKELKNINPVINSNNDQILGSVIYIDNYGNVITNIKKELFLDVKKIEITLLKQEILKLIKLMILIHLL